jgi:CubicO group peptidase (beta-lactamase class C family)
MKRRDLLTLPLALGPTLALARGASPERALAALLDDPATPLASLSVWARRRDGRVFSAQWGRRQIEDGRAARDLPVTPDTLLRVASISKLVVGLGVMRLVEAGRLQLDADLQPLLGFELRHPAAPAVPITLRHLMTHRAGLTDEADAYRPAGQPLAPLVARDSKAWGPQPRGGHFQYCNLNYGLIASAMERASGERFDRLMQREVLAPLGMQGGFEAASFPPEQQAQIATLYRRPPGGAWVAQVDDFSVQPIQPTLTPEQAAAYAPGFNGS